jgi:TetR/AcrR family transcriptional regulator, tetracycline repressor protein
VTAADVRITQRGRGRPARLSYEQIVEAAVGVLMREPLVSLTVKRLAEAVGSTPMALYHYFPDRDTLLQAAADHVLATTEHIPLVDGDWQERLRAWMHGCQDRLQPYPQLLPYMISTQQPAWLPALVVLSELLEPVGLDARDLALAATLISSTVIGYAVYASHRPPAEDAVRRLTSALRDRPAAEADVVLPLLAELPGAYDRLYETVIDQTIAAIEDLASAVVDP